MISIKKLNNYLFIVMIYVKYINNSTKQFKKFNEIFDDNQLDIILLNCSYNNLTELPELKEFSIENRVFPSKRTI
jgi:hypothetical protein